MRLISSNPLSDRKRLRRREVLFFAVLGASAAAWLAWAALRDDATGLVAAAIGAISLVAVFAFSRLVAQRRRFCPSCGTLVTRGLRRPKAGFGWCSPCDKLVDPSAVLLGPPGSLDLSHRRRLAEAPGMSRLVCAWVMMAIRDRATELAFVPEQERLNVIEVVGDVRHELCPPPFHLVREIIGTIKAFAGLDVGNERDSQQGAIDVMFADGHVPILVRTQPTEFGETVRLQLPGSEEGSAAAKAARGFI